MKKKYIIIIVLFIFLIIFTFILINIKNKENIKTIKIPSIEIIESAIDEFQETAEETKAETVEEEIKEEIEAEATEIEAEKEETESPIQTEVEKEKPIKVKAQSENYQTWTASNGVVLKLKPEVEQATIDNVNLHSENDLITRIAEPETPEHDAIYEYIYGGKQGAENAQGDYDYDKLASMPISTAGSKQSSIAIDSELKAFDDVLVGNLMVALTGKPDVKTNVPLLGLLSDSSGIQMNTNTTGAVGFRIDFGSEQHILKIYKALTKSEWLALKNVMKKLGYSDAYDSIYDECYNDTLPEEIWSTVGNCEVYPIDTTGLGYVEFYIK